MEKVVADIRAQFEVFFFLLFVFFSFLFFLFLQFSMVMAYPSSEQYPRPRRLYCIQTIPVRYN